MRRREFITLLGGAMAPWPLAARAQQLERVRRIGVLMNTAPGAPEGKSRLEAFRQALQELGWAGLTDGTSASLDQASIGDSRGTALDGYSAAVDENGSGRVAAGRNRVIEGVAERCRNAAGWGGQQA
jgi:hypothetical protein